MYNQVQVQVRKYTSAQVHKCTSTQVQASSVVRDQVLAAALLAPDVYRGSGFNWKNTTLCMRYMYKSIYKYIKVFKVYEKSI